MLNLRPAQARVLSYSGGRMGISAVPGSGKTYTLSALAARLVAEGGLEDDQEVLIVTLVNSAVNNFARQVGLFVKESGLLPNLGYRVRTLHGLAHDIVRERPALAGLASDFTIVDERASDEILNGAVTEWVHTHPNYQEMFITENGRNRYKTIRDDWPFLVKQISLAFIRTAKDLNYTPGMIRQNLQDVHTTLPLVEMGLEIYSTYQRGLGFRGAVDFSDLIRLCLQVLNSDPDYLARLKHRWPYILEDEAQDSSELQQRILELLSGEQGNWVRVGDTNQAIFETFTTASPRFLREFLEKPGVTALELPNSGRSQDGVMRVANALVDWACDGHLHPSGRSAFKRIHIQPTGTGDPQPNPEENFSAIHLFMNMMDGGEEVKTIVDSLKRWLPAHSDETVAVLVSTNPRGVEFVNALKAANLPYLELLRSSHSTREAVRALQAGLRCMASPAMSKPVEELFKTWWNFNQGAEEAPFPADAARAVLGCKMMETYLHPSLELDWLGQEPARRLDQASAGLLNNFREVLQRWHAAAILPIGQLALTMAQDLFHEPADLATAAKVAALLDTGARSHPEWGLEEFAGYLEDIVQNRLKYTGLSEEDNGFDPRDHCGKVIVSTMHKAKGLEFDRVFITSVNNYDFPSGRPEDEYYSEKWFIVDRRNLEAEAVYQLKMLKKGDHAAVVYTDEVAEEARGDVIAERLRLLYVGITRAKKELILTWNTGSRKNQAPAEPLKALNDYWQGVLDGTRS